MGTICDCLHLKVYLKKKNYLYVNPLPKGVQIQMFKTFLIEDFFHFPFQGLGGNLFMKKTFKSKISLQCPFKCIKMTLRQDPLQK
jgi:hypothetical protein